MPDFSVNDAICPNKLISPPLTICQFNGQCSFTCSVVHIFGGRIVILRAANYAPMTIISVIYCEHRTLKPTPLFFDNLPKHIFVTLCEARRFCRFALNSFPPARTVWQDAVGMELGRYGGAGNGENVARGGAGGDSRRGVGVKDGQSSPV